MTTEGVADRLERVKERIASAAARAGRDPASITLVGVSKRKPAESVAAAVEAGLEHIGESYVQEALHKLESLEGLLSASGSALPLRHFVGRLQRNKAKEAVRLFDVIESVDRIPLAKELGRRAADAGRTLTALLQVDLGEEPQKGGVAPEALPELLDACQGLRSLSVVGLMTVPPAGPNPEGARRFFARLRELRESLGARNPDAPLPELSMGMSADLEVAIEEGATWVRVGTAIFGPRED